MAKSLKTYQYKTRAEAAKDAQAYSWDKQQQIKASAGNGKLMRAGTATLMYLYQEQQLVIFTEPRHQCIEARVSRDGTFQLVRVIGAAQVVEATGAAEIKALACYAELHGLWMLAISKGLVG